MLTADGVRVLGASDAPAVRAILDSDPVGNVYVAARLRSVGFEAGRLGAELWGYGGSTGVESLCFSGANLIPVCTTPAASRAFARRALRQTRLCSSILGREPAVEGLWDRLRTSWAPARDVRTGQPLLVISAPPAVPADPAVRRVRVSEVETLLPACVEMYTEEVGVSPIGSDGGAAYRARIRDLVTGGYSYARIENGEVIFKAEIGAVAAGVCQVQGVWVTPRLRGRGLGAAGMSSVIGAAFRTVAPVVSLYVNAHNVAARRTYERVGFSPAGTLMSVLF